MSKSFNVALNALQFATLNVLRDDANSKGVIPASSIGLMKRNTILALLGSGALVTHYNDFKVNPNAQIVERAPHVHRESTLMKMAERAAAPRNPVGRPRKVQDEQLAA